MRQFLFAVGIVWSVSNPSTAEPLIDSEVTHFGNYTATLIAPTTRYKHGALGDTVETGGFNVAFNGKTLSYKLPSNQVFEDLRVRLYDLDGNGVPEAIIIRSDLKRGASIAVYDIGENQIKLRAASPFIGKPNRWLNIVGFGDFVGNGKTTIAAVITPHLAGSLRLYNMIGNKLVEQERIDGFTNHINGTRNLDLAKIRDVDGDGIVDIVLPVLDRSSLATITFKGGRARVLGQ